MLYYINQCHVGRIYGSTKNPRYVFLVLEDNHVVPIPKVGTEVYKGARMKVSKALSEGPIFFPVTGKFEVDEPDPLQERVDAVQEELDSLRDELNRR